MFARVWEGGVPPPTVGSFFIFRLENVQSGAYLRRKFRLDDMYYMGKLFAFHILKLLFPSISYC